MEQETRDPAKGKKEKKKIKKRKKTVKQGIRNQKGEICTMHQKLMESSNWPLIYLNVPPPVKSEVPSHLVGRKSLSSEDQVNARHSFFYSYFEEPAAKASLQCLPPAFMTLYGIFPAPVPIFDADMNQ